MKNIAVTAALLICLAACNSSEPSAQADAQPAVNTETSHTHLGGCIMTAPVGEVPTDLYMQSDVVPTDQYPPFTKKLTVYGITLIAQDDVPDSFLKLLAQTITEIFPRQGDIDLELQAEVIRNLYRYRTVIAVPHGEGLAFHEGNEQVWEQTKSRNTICDIIMHGLDDGQVMEVIEHILHFVSDVGLHYTFPNEWGLAPATRSELRLAMNEAIDKGYYNVDDYSNFDDADSEVRDRVLLQEFAYWVISTAWNLQEPYGPQDMREWTIRNEADLKTKFPRLYEAYSQTAAKVMAAPSRSTLARIGPTRKEESDR